MTNLWALDGLSSFLQERYLLANHHLRNLNPLMVVQAATNLVETPTLLNPYLRLTPSLE
jgi:hypothetical protein